MLGLLAAVARVGNFGLFAGFGAVRLCLCLAAPRPVGNAVLGHDIGHVSGFVANIGIAVLDSTSLFGVVDGIRLSVRVRVAVAVTAMAVVVEQEKTDNVGGETKTSDDQNKLGVADFLRLDKTLDGF